MKKTSTNNENANCSNESLTEDLDCRDDLDARYHRFYSVISSHLNLIQIHPKEETVLRIMTYSKNQNKPST
jgi:hypothetical protein